MVQEIGGRTWYAVQFSEPEEIIFAADIASGEYAIFEFVGLSIEDSDIEKILLSLEVLPGDPYQNSKLWREVHFKLPAIGTTVSEF